MTKPEGKQRTYDLEERTLRFARECIDICRLVMKDAVNRELVSQLVRAASSVGANYREANEALTKREFYHRIGICRKEAKESRYWLELLQHANAKCPDKIVSLIDEAFQLSKIFAAISRSSPA